MLSGVRVNGRTVRKTKEAPATQLFRQIDIDLHPYVKSGISKAMIEGVYCGLEDGGFRVQIKDNKIYVAGEALGIQSRNRNVKLHLLGVAMRYPNSPEVDFIVGTGDCPGRKVRNVSGMSAGGPMFAQASLLSFVLHW